MRSPGPLPATVNWPNHTETAGERIASILVCILYYLPHRTGMQLYVQRLAEGLVTRGHQVTVLAARHRRDLPGEEAINGVRVVRPWTLPFSLSRGMLVPGYPAAVRRLVREHDIVSVHTPMLEAGLVAMLASAAGKPVITTHHGDLRLPAGPVNRAIERIMFGQYRFLARRSAAVVAYSEDYAAHSRYLKPYREKVQAISPPVGIPEPNAEAARAFRARWSFQGAPLIGFAGRLVEEKRPDVLIRSLDTVSRRFPRARIIFAGDRAVGYEQTGRALRPLLEKYGDSLEFLGILTGRQDMANFYAACDVLALTSDTECFGLVQVEAMLCGTPVVMTDIPGGRVPVTLTGMGLVARPGDPRDIGEKIIEVIARRDRYVKSRQRIEAIFPAGRSVDAYAQLFAGHAAVR